MNIKYLKGPPLQALTGPSFLAVLLFSLSWAQHTRAHVSLAAIPSQHI